LTALRRAVRVADRAIQSDTAWRLIGAAGITTALAALWICTSLGGAS
jgi:hypothetical protein